jgi:hypothetical protein
MDEVIVNARDCLASHLNQHTGKNISPEAWHQYDLGKTYDVDHPTLLSIFHSSKMLETALLEDDVLPAMTLAKRLGYKIGVLTARGWHAQGLELTKASLEKFELPVDHTVAVPLEVSKHDVIRMHFPGGIVGFVDDNPSHIKGVTAIGIPSYVRDRPWNRDLFEYPRVFSLIDFVESVHLVHSEQLDLTRDVSILRQP